MRRSFYPQRTGESTSRRIRPIRRAFSPCEIRTVRSSGLDALWTVFAQTSPFQGGQQRDQPNGWAPLQWIAIVGLNDYHLSPLAQIIAPRWTCENLAGYQRSGTLVEKCDLARGGGKGPFRTQISMTTPGCRRKSLQNHWKRRIAGRCVPTRSDTVPFRRRWKTQWTKTG